MTKHAVLKHYVDDVDTDDDKMKHMKWVSATIKKAMPKGTEVDSLRATLRKTRLSTLTLDKVTEYNETMTNLFAALDELDGKQTESAKREMFMNGLPFSVQEKFVLARDVRKIKSCI
jgi:hypothetical protein